MAQWEIVAWRDIPAVVEARDDAGQVTLSLSDKFQSLIDSVAMQLGVHDEDAYLEHWGATDGDRPGTARDVSAAIASELEDRFPEFITLAFRRP